MAEKLTAKQQVLAMLDRGWLWRDAHSDVLVHPQDYGLYATFDRVKETLTLSPALNAALALIIPTPTGRNPRHRRNEQKEKPKVPKV
ncbi:MAG TPA: hypothetical protein VGE74_12805 [Gemmata sp.]